MIQYLNDQTLKIGFALSIYNLIFSASGVYAACYNLSRKSIRFTNEQEANSGKFSNDKDMSHDVQWHNVHCTCKSKSSPLQYRTRMACMILLGSGRPHCGQHQRQAGGAL